MNDNKIIDRLQKLLNLAGNNPSVAEAEAAMAKAQAVALEHGIDLALLGESHVENQTEIHLDDMEFGKRLPTVNNYVCNILVDYFSVKIITTGGRHNGRKLVFVGKRADIDTAKYVYTWLAETMVRCWHRYYSATPGAVIGQKQSYLAGFHSGLSDKLDANKRNVEGARLTTEPDKQTYAVAVVNLQKKMDVAIATAFGKVKDGGKKKIQMDAASYGSGVAAGLNCQISKGGISGNSPVARIG